MYQTILISSAAKPAINTNNNKNIEMDGKSISKSGGNGKLSPNNPQINLTKATTINKI